MKTIRKILIASLGVVALGFASCDTLDQEYPSGYDAGTMYESPEKIAAAAVGMYDAMQNLNFLGGRAQIYVDIRSNDTNVASYFNAMSTMDGTMNSTNAIVGDAWEGAYRTLFEINLFIEGVTGSEVITDEAREQYINEARFLRGVVYFYTVNLWGDQFTKDSKGMGVPYIDRSYDGASGFGEEAKVARSTTAEIYTKIIEDITAGTKLEVERSADEAKMFATPAAAWAMLSRVYLYQKNYSAAIDAAAKVTGYTLDADPAATMFTVDPFGGNEIIFWIAHNQTDNPNTNNALGQHYGITGRGDITLSNSYISLFDKENDIRFKDLIYADEQEGGAVVYYTNKYPDRSFDWAPIVRYAEVILNEAESRAQQATGVDETAITLVNKIRTRAGVSTVAAGDFTSKQALVDFILAERRRELGFEGHGSFDLFRNEKGIDAGRGSAAAAAVTYPNNLFALPIPSGDILKADGVLVQNPGYN